MNEYCSQIHVPKNSKYNRLHYKLRDSQYVLGKSRQEYFYPLSQFSIATKNILENI